MVVIPHGDHWGGYYKHLGRYAKAAMQRNSHEAGL
jgi:hypothetical protein